MSVSVLPGRTPARSDNPETHSCGGTLGSAEKTASSSSSSTLEESSSNKIIVAQSRQVVVGGVACSSSSSSVARGGGGSEGRSGLGRRHYSSSESECVSSSTTGVTTTENVSAIQRKRSFDGASGFEAPSSSGAAGHQRAQGGGRGKRRRFNNNHSPITTTAQDGVVVTGLRGGGKKHGGGGAHQNALPRVPLTQQPKAPNNTTQFLITDREERESSDRDTTTEDFSGLGQLRPRCFSSACHGKNDESSALNLHQQLNSSDSDEEQEEEDLEFQTIYDSVTLERIEGLPREKVNREMLTTQKTNSHLVDKVTHLKSENNRLKGLLQQHGIDFNRSPLEGSSTLPPLFGPRNVLDLSHSASRSSVESEGNVMEHQKEDMEHPSALEVKEEDR